jgi:DNA-binding MarR family transcriptional regulator
MARSVSCSTPDRGVINPLENQLGYQLRRASAQMLGDLTRHLDDLDLKPSDAATLMLIATNPGITLSAVGRELGIHRANMTPIAAMLTGRHLIERSRADGRSQGLAVTGAGAALFNEINARIAAHEAPFLRRLQADERRMIMKLIKKIRSD